jgi:hypothetical protein
MSGAKVLYTSCVPDCSVAHPGYVNDPITGYCLECGPECK